MRFARLVSPTLLTLLTFSLVAVAVTGCSDPPPPIPEGAWSINFQPPDDFTKCSIQQHITGIGTVTDNKQTQLVADGTSGASVSCSVTGEKKFKVSADTFQMGTSIHLSVDNLTESATLEAPVPGTLSYLSGKTGSPFSSSKENPCQFYFVPGSGEAIAPGSVWVAFKCPELVGNGGMSSCQITQGYATFKNCTGLTTAM